MIDGPQSAAVEEVLREAQAGAAGSLSVVRNPERRGFVASVNRGMADSGGTWCSSTATPR